MEHTRFMRKLSVLLIYSKTCSSLYLDKLRPEFEVKLMIKPTIFARAENILLKQFVEIVPDSPRKSHLIQFNPPSIICYRSLEPACSAFVHSPNPFEWFAARPSPQCLSVMWTGGREGRIVVFPINLSLLLTDWQAECPSQVFAPSPANSVIPKGIRVPIFPAIVLDSNSVILCHECKM